MFEMDTKATVSQIKQGKFLRHDKDFQTQYVAHLKKKIEDGYYSSHIVIYKIAELLAPTFQDCLEQE